MTSSSGCCATGCSRRCASADPEVEEGFDVRGGALEPGRLAGLAGRAQRRGTALGLAVVGTHLAFDADATALAIVAADGEGCYLDTATLNPDDEAALASWLADPDPPKALHEAKLAMHDLAGRGWNLEGVTSDTALAAYLVRPGQRSFALDDLAVRYLRRELRADNPEQQQLSLLDDSDGVDDQAVQTLILRASAVADLADALDEELARIDSSALLGEMELPGSAGAGRDGAHRHRGRPRPARRTAEHVRRPDPRRRRSGLRGDRQADQPWLAEAAAGGAVRRARDAEDQAHQDRLHHRRGRAAVAVRQDRTSVPAAPARPTATPPGSRSPSTGC